jgi:transposase-like protein
MDGTSQRKLAASKKRRTRSPSEKERIIREYEEGLIWGESEIVLQKHSASRQNISSWKKQLSMTAISNTSKLRRKNKGPLDRWLNR